MLRIKIARETVFSAVKMIQLRVQRDNCIYTANDRSMQMHSTHNHKQWLN